MLSDWELWAVANAVLKLHRERAPLFVAERIGALAAEGDAEGVAAWQATARRRLRRRRSTAITPEALGGWVAALQLLIYLAQVAKLTNPEMSRSSCGFVMAAWSARSCIGRSS